MGIYAQVHIFNDKSLMILIMSPWVFSSRWGCIETPPWTVKAFLSRPSPQPLIYKGIIWLPFCWDLKSGHFFSFCCSTSLLQSGRLSPFKFSLAGHMDIKLEGSGNGGAASDNFLEVRPSHFCSWVGQDAGCSVRIRIPLADRCLKLGFSYAQLWVTLISRFAVKVQPLFCFTSSMHPNRPLALHLHYQCQEIVLCTVQS